MLLGFLLAGSEQFFSTAFDARLPHKKPPN
jgi:hypothetical protein